MFSHYVAGREPPSMLDRVLSNPFLVPFAVASFVVGILIFVSVVSGAEVSRSLAEMSPWLRLAVAVPLVVGAPVSLAGALHVWHRWSRLEAMFIERAGDIALGAGWLAYGLAVALSGNPLATVTAWVSLGLAVAYALRCWALGVSEKRVRRAVEVEQQIGG